MNAIDSADSFWGSSTSRANFCEIDYAVSRYIAEFVNSLTNVVYSKIPEVIYGLYGLRQLRRKADTHGDSLRALPYWGLIAVGLCSFAFHLSLKYHTQMMDDLSMHFATTPVLHRVLTANSNRRDSIVVAIALASMLLFLVTFHVITDELVLHSVSFVGTVTVIGVHTIRLVNSRTLPGSAARRQIWGMVRFGATIFNLGYWLWLIDQWACGFLTKAREAIGLPWAFVLELHGWWHICTGIGAYIFIAVVDHLVASEDLSDIQQSFTWPASWASTSVFAGRGSSVDKDVSEKQK
ncbi:alkaline phytoceramidase [Aspergillus pseudonomiae]|uniref:Alkaline phytoceramidase n=1 Tax=Aspergillus pseudonomiae TaxID=1506151 RepID=A0A5N7DHU9_9EURO|nr:alkaline phytoceramidase [Aspergillus pseudonomiae]KAB8264610.1 alkaline phytoceramidase [Aspergillus pseudonomiae]KAE8406010.1 alkaline phytoceramidase [Aspergillus pseudonomiae]